MLRGWAGSSSVRVVEGAWFAAGQDRALLLARSRAGGMDIPAQEAATAAIQAAFLAASPGPARLLVAGPAVFARDAARAIRGDVERIALLSTGLVALLLWWRSRSALVLAAIAVPVVLSIAAAALVVQLGYGALHGVALGFGITMLGVSLDYPVLMIGHRKAGEPAMATRARIGPAFVLAVITATLGLAAMVFSGFPGLSQLGVFSAAGLAAAALATWWLLPRLVVAAELAPVSAGNPAWLAPVEGLRRWRLLGLLPVLAAALYLAARGGPDWEGDLQSLSPVPAASRALDAELRAQLGAPEVTQLLVIQGADAEAVLRRQEELWPVLERLRAAGALAGAELAARLLPSIATQEARRAALPAPGELARRLAAAGAGLPFRPDAFAPFLQAVAASRDLPPLRPENLAGTPLGARLEPLLFQREGRWHGPVALRGGARRGRDPGGARWPGGRGLCRHAPGAGRHPRPLYRPGLALARLDRVAGAGGAGGGAAGCRAGGAGVGLGRCGPAGGGGSADPCRRAAFPAAPCRLAACGRHRPRLRTLLLAPPAGCGGKGPHLAYAGDLQRHDPADLRPAGGMPDPAAARYRLDRGDRRGARDGLRLPLCR
ncbi:MMPL family transporter [Siccirubricoccus sp. G192]|uniref:MMPL family transporter n=1 Tax=Siccirubricoccus sp. G192 TaxID=2849651 RepID=UPI001C2C6046|nr:MMPL family transporter [Siccirubricoccus sp. G192]MBV1800279.1 MMPL family transporter [Siccirubricoccus sp. G192]